MKVLMILILALGLVGCAGADSDDVKRTVRNIEDGNITLPEPELVFETYEWTMKSAQKWGPDSFHQLRYHDVEVTGKVKLPEALFVTQGISDKSWVTVDIEDQRFCYTGDPERDPNYVYLLKAKDRSMVDAICPAFNESDLEIKDPYITVREGDELLLWANGYGRDMTRPIFEVEATFIFYYLP